MRCFAQTYEDALIAVQRLDTSERKILIRGGSDARYLPTGHLIYRRSTSLFAVPFDLDRLEVGGQPVRVAEGIAHYADANKMTADQTSALRSLVPLGTAAWTSIDGFHRTEHRSVRPLSQTERALEGCS